jgi:hypothetical protein
MYAGANCVSIGGAWAMGGDGIVRAMFFAAFSGRRFDAEAGGNAGAEGQDRMHDGEGQRSNAET